ncbi:MAG: DEAD/DEAH box helicase [Chloroflexota bacterium]|nr:MAG: DEAD/DEAH box helicase [Chloroflexota bacterium]
MRRPGAGETPAVRITVSTSPESQLSRRRRSFIGTFAPIQCPASDGRPDRETNVDIFALRDAIIGRYRSYVRSFVAVRNPDTRRKVEEYFDRGELWPEPLVQINPSFRLGPTIDELVANGALDHRLGAIFRRGKSPEDPNGKELRLHHHQAEAIRIAATGASYVLTTGTGSGKSLAYIIPIVNHVIRRGSGKGIQAIVVYPMNALANSQLVELEKFLDPARTGHPPVTFARYTGQEDDVARELIRAKPPDILLTNFVMLELILTRPVDKVIVDRAKGLEFLVLDELHTYRGRQGADVAMLVRRVRDRVEAPNMRCIGTSATLASEGTGDERAKNVARVASNLFGQTVRPEHVIGETLRRAIDEPLATDAQLRNVVANPAAIYPTDFAEFKKQPLVAWAEMAFGLEESEGLLERRKPRSIADVAADLVAKTNLTSERCQEELRRLLLAGNEVEHPVTGRPLFAFRLHQFIGRGDRVFVTAEPPETRHVTTKGQLVAPGPGDRALLPLAFCRECGAEYIVAFWETGDNRITPRGLSQKPSQDTIEAGFVILDRTNEIEFDPSDFDRLPEDWTENRNGFERPKREYLEKIPRAIFVTPRGDIRSANDGTTSGPEETPGWWFPTPFGYCLVCKTEHHNVREQDFARLAELSTEGRATATTILSLATVTELRGTDGLDDDVKKLLSFTDNRQDASLQAGHFNDFIQVARLRSALSSAVDEAGDVGLTHDRIADVVLTHLYLEPVEYARNPGAFRGDERIRETLRELVAYLLFHDLRRGWRVNSPNLEQLGLLDIGYDRLDDFAAADEVWSRRHPRLASASPTVRRRILTATLDQFRRELAIDARYLKADFQAQFKDRADQRLREPWTVAAEDRLDQAVPMPPPIVGRRRAGRGSGLGPTTIFGRYMRSPGTWRDDERRGGVHVTPQEYRDIFVDLLAFLADQNYLVTIGKGDDLAYLLPADVIQWKKGDGKPRRDPIRRTGADPTAEVAANEFFQTFYRANASALRALSAREHTAQVDQDDREEREKQFKTAALPILYCSPTMELGVDIAGLQAVHMRNVPPTPANYAQRAGRAGRNGQPALVLTYCSNGSPHDSYYFRDPRLMVGGAVQAPRIDLVNEDLIRAHVHAILLAEMNLALGDSVAEVVELSEAQTLPLTTAVKNAFQNSTARTNAIARAERVLADLRPDLAKAPWFGDTWLNAKIGGAVEEFDRATDRWRRLFGSATEQMAKQQATLNDATRTAEERLTARSLHNEALTQRELLLASNVSRRQSDFYSYRYFASEGFLPGYNFPRLPLSAFLSGRGKPRGGDVFLSRARFLAISEFGPRSIIYHEGNRYRIERVLFTSQDAERTTSTGKVCAACGYGHIGGELAKADVCAECANPLTGKGVIYFDKLLRLTNVGARPISRITSDEEERLRIGYQVATAFRIDPQSPRRDATYTVAPRDGASTDPVEVASATYAPAATLWRINLGWAARKEKERYGFPIDMSTGRWRRAPEQEDTADDSDEGADPTAGTRTKIETVVPFVEDRRNTLLLRLPTAGDDGNALASALYALKRGIEVHYQIEDRELAGETLPSERDRRLLLFYEAVEGGAGVLAQLVDDRTALATVARQALTLCHFDPDTGADLAVQIDDREPCMRACHECLLSYGNQRAHSILNRHLARDILLDLAAATANVTTAGRAPPEQFEYLLAKCTTSLERDFLRFLRDRGHNLPTEAQVRVRDSRPDFWYADTDDRAAVFVDGPVHDDRRVAERDEAVRSRLSAAGVQVIPIGHDPAAWPAAVAEFGWVFGAAGTHR